MEEKLKLKEKIILNVLMLVVRILTKHDDKFSTFYCEFKDILDLVNRD